MEQLTGLLTGIGHIEAKISKNNRIVANLASIKQFVASVSPVANITGLLSSINSIECELDIYKGGATPVFPGGYEYTPAQEEQIIPIAGFKATRNIIINPIPNNYGLITWNGSTLTVS